MNKKLIISALVIALLSGTAGLGISNAHAQEKTIILPPIVKGFIEKFNLNENEVKQFIQEQRQNRQVERKTVLEEKLNEAVSEGKITEDQKNALLAKIEEKRANKEEFMNLPREERHETIQKNREEFRTWAEENGINLAELNLGPHFHGYRAGIRGFKSCL